MTKSERYAQVLREVRAIFAEEGGAALDEIALMATINSLLVTHLENFFWTGFYRRRGELLIVGPYIGTVGCLQIEIGKGVCGAAAAKRETVIVPDVEKFPGHIACDPRSRSEIVVPVFDGNDALIGVLDVDSDRLDNFDEVDRQGLEQVCRLFRDPDILPL